MLAFMLSSENKETSNSTFNELREIFSFIAFWLIFLGVCVWLLSSLSRDPRASKLYSNGLYAMRYLQDEESSPDFAKEFRTRCGYVSVQPLVGS